MQEITVTEPTTISVESDVIKVDGVMLFSVNGPNVRVSSNEFSQTNRGCLLYEGSVVNLMKQRTVYFKSEGKDSIEVYLSGDYI